MVEHGVIGDGGVITKQLEVIAIARCAQRERGQVICEGDVVRCICIAQHHAGVGFDDATECGTVAVRQRQGLQRCDQAHGARHSHGTGATSVQRQGLRIGL